MNKSFKPVKKTDEPGLTGVRQIVVSGASGQRIDNFLARELRGVPKARIYRMLRTGEVRRNGSRVQPSDRVADGDVLRIPPVIRAGHVGTAATVPISDDITGLLTRRILFEDDDLLIIDKPAGIAVHGGSGIAWGAVEALRRVRPDVELELGHRLDRDTSGCLLFAKHRSALLAVHRALREREVRKRYAVLVAGRWSRRVATVQLPLEKYVLKSGERRVRVSQEGKPARTDFSVVATTDRASWLDARLHTGRTHQIRVHAATSGHAVLGDVKYAPPAVLGLATECSINRLCLHARELVFEHRGARLRVEAPVPAEFMRAWQSLGGAVETDQSVD
ncbi:MAG: RluA family pseudouridine synthase [Pseudomonadales bacterium]